MASHGRIQALCIATQDKDNVVYERFYDLFSENDKADIRAAFAESTTGLDRKVSNEGVGSYRDGYIVAVPSGELFFYALGTEEYNELILAEILRSLIAAFKEILHVKVLTDKSVFAHYAQAALIADAVIKEGIPELLDTASIISALSFKFPSLQPEDEAKVKGKGRKAAA